MGDIPKLVGLAGLAGSGKDTVADYMVKYYHYTKVSFADELKHAAKDLGWDGNKDQRGRFLLQDLGSVMRRYDPETWIRLLRYTLMILPPTSRVVVSDVRHHNEAEFLHARGGVVFRLEGRGGLTGQAATHESEIHGTSLAVDGVLNNSGTLEDLYEVVDHVICGIIRDADGGHAQALAPPA